MTKEVQVEAKRPFNRTPQGDICDVGDRFPVGEARAAELERLSLAGRVSPKVAPKPSNKMAPAPADKAEG